MHCVVQESESKIDLREYHYDMIKFRGLSEHHHELMCKHFQACVVLFSVLTSFVSSVLPILMSANWK